MFVQFGSVGVNMANVTHWELLKKDNYSYLEEDEYRLYLNHVSDGFQNYISITGNDIKPFESWVSDSVTRYY